MAQTRVSMRMDSAIKREAEAHVAVPHVAEPAETPPRLKREGWYVPAGEEDDPFWSVSNLRALNRAIEGIEAGHVVVKTMEELDAMACT